MTERDNPLGELEAVYLDGDWDRAFRRAAASGRASLDVIRILLIIGADLRRVRELLEIGTDAGNRSIPR